MFTLLSTTMKSLTLLTILVLVFCSDATTTQPIKYVVVLMMENHSFDQMLGFHPNPEIGQASTTMYNHVDPANTSSPIYNVTKGAPFCLKPDPIHIVPDVADQVNAPNPAYGASYRPTMGGFVSNFVTRAKADDPGGVMQMFAPEQVPVISALAESFTTFTRWFSDIAGSTGINRLMAHAGQSGSYTGGDYEWGVGGLVLEDSRSLIGDVLDAGYSAKVHYVDFCSAHAIDTLAHAHPDVFHRSHQLEAFFDDVKEATLANYTFLVPQLFPSLTSYPTSQHPSGDVRAGEVLIKQVYDTLVDSPYWNETLFVLLYDEHGGFYDSQPPPGPGVGSGPVPDPNPDAPTHPFAYDWTRLGVRIPSLAISPWLDSAVISDDFQTTSLPATIRKMWNLDAPPLSPRSAAAPTFESLFRATPRHPSSYPKSLPHPPEGPYCHILDNEPPTAPEFLSMYDQLLDRAGIDLGGVRGSDLTTAFAAHDWIVKAGDALLRQYRNRKPE